MSIDAAPESSPPLQFDQVELPTGSLVKLCGLCGATIADTYFESGGRVLCPACSDKVSGKAGGWGAFPRAALWGAGAAILGTIAWVIIMKVTGMELGIVAVGVGLLVGRAVQRGSRGRGGWRYQLLAMFLSYASICTSYVPFVMKGMSEELNKQDEQKKKAAETANAVAAAEVRPAADAKDDAAAKAPPTAVGVVVGLLFIWGIAFAAPFLGGFENIMGLLIIAVALYEAWKLNRRVIVAGPFRMATESAAPAGAAGTP